ncbi:MAG: hypothetical protein V4671_31690 [Armatimonadota bacterium]
MEKKRTLLRRTFAGAIAAVVVAFLLVGPRYLSRFAVSDVRAAVQRAKTWHFVGWRIQDGRKVRWEVWGRRSPFFYREQIGQEILIDDGKQRMRLFPAGGTANRPRPVVLKMPSQTLMETGRSLANQSRAFLVGIGGGDAWGSFPSNPFNPYKEQSDGTILLNAPGTIFGNIRESARMTVEIASRRDPPDTLKNGSLLHGGTRPGSRR